jgi:hypothetical protein
MRRFIIFTATILIAASALAASEVYRWKDANGTWHYSDQPHPGAELVRRGNRPVTDASTGTAATPAPAAPAPAPAADSNPPPVSDAIAAQVRQEAAAVKSEQCKKADEIYQKAVQARRITKTDGSFMSSEEIDAYRLQARSARDLSCGPGA